MFTPPSYPPPHAPLAPLFHLVFVTVQFFQKTGMRGASCKGRSLVGWRRSNVARSIRAYPPFSRTACQSMACGLITSILDPCKYTDLCSGPYGVHRCSMMYSCASVMCFGWLSVGLHSVSTVFNTLLSAFPVRCGAFRLKRSRASNSVVRSPTCLRLLSPRTIVHRV